MRALKGARTADEARIALARIEARIADGKPAAEPLAPGAAPVGPLMERWRDSLANRNAKNDGGRVTRYLLPKFKAMTMGGAQSLPAVMRWLDSVQAENPQLGGQSLRHCLNLLSRFFAWAIERGHAEVNPVRMIPQGKRPHGAEKADGPWLQDDDQFRALFQALPEPANLIFWLGNRSGMRPGEAAGVTMADFAWLHEGVIRVGHSYGGPLKEDRRGVGKVKWVPATSDAAAVVGPWLARRRAEGAGDSDLVFPYCGGSDRPRQSRWTGYKKEHLQSLWEAARKVVGVDLTIYQATRHSFVSRHLSAGVSLEEVSAAIGHAQVTTTRRFYDHYVRRSYSAAIRAATVLPANDGAARDCVARQSR
jgi:integrase